MVMVVLTLLAGEGNISCSDFGHICESFPSRTGGSPRAGISGQTPDLWSCILKVGSSTILMTATAFTFIFPISLVSHPGANKEVTALVNGFPRVA